MCANTGDEFLLDGIGVLECPAREGSLIVQDLAAYDFVDPCFVDLQLAQRLGELIRIAGGHEIGGRALQHRDVVAVSRDRRDERRRGGTRADHDDLLVAVVQVLRPGLRMNDPALEGSIPSQCGV